MTRRWAVAKWVFVVPLVWLGFVLAISFMEAPLKFRAPNVTLPIGVGIGQVVFHALNRVEVVFGALVAIALFANRHRGSTALSAVAVNATLVVQTVLLYGPLDDRVAAIVAGRPVDDAPWHMAYIALEILKVILLVGLAARFIGDFRDAERSASSLLD